MLLQRPRDILNHKVFLAVALPKSRRAVRASKSHALIEIGDESLGGKVKADCEDAEESETCELDHDTDLSDPSPLIVLRLCLRVVCVHGGDDQCSAKLEKERDY